MLIRIREYLRPLYEDADTLDIIVRVYANLEGLANFLVRQDKVRNLGQLRAFSTGFCGRISSFDWIDVGVGKEGNSGRKVRGQQQSTHITCPPNHSLVLRKPLLLYSKLSSPPRNPRLLANRPPPISPLNLAARKTHTHRIPTNSHGPHNTSPQSHQILNLVPTTTHAQTNKNTHADTQWNPTTAYAAR